jgi:hypothetical protein
LSPQIAEPVSGDAFRSLCDHTFWSDLRPFEDPAFRHGDIVFCKIDEVWRLFRSLRRTRKRIVLVTGEGDKPVHAALWRRRPPHVAVWFGTNMQVRDNQAARGLPLGLGNARGKKTVTHDQIRQTAELRLPRVNLLYANFSTHSNEATRGSLAAWLRESSQAWINFADHGGPGAKENYVRSLSTHQFVLCPPGNGEDTHRFWESLYCGATPVIRNSAAMSHFHDTGALFLPDLREIRPETLREFAPPLNSAPNRCLELGQWRPQFARARQSILNRASISTVEFLLGWMREVRALLQR